MKTGLSTVVIILMTIMLFGAEYASADSLQYTGNSLRYGCDPQAQQHNGPQQASQPTAIPSEQTGPQVASQQQQVNNNRYCQIIYAHILKTSPSLGADWANWETLTILSACQQWKVDPLLVTALFTQESGFIPSACSPQGAIGIAQLMPGTASALGVDPNDPGQNILGGVEYLAQQMGRFSSAGEWTSTFAVAAYNAGPEAVAKYGGIPPYTETQNYVQRVGAIYTRLLNKLNA
jgi:soluble lytic murein transglycosylase-like protein